MSELKPCPFCGGEAKYQMAGLRNCIVQCDRGALCLHLAPNDKPGEARDSWNTRPTEDALRAELECMKEQETLIAVEATKLRALCRDMYEMLSETYTGRKLLANAHDGPELFDKRYRGVMGDE